MKTVIAARGFTLTPALTNAIEREARTLQRRLNGRAGHLAVRLYDINGHHGGNDKACSVQMRFYGDTAAILATDIDSDMYRAIAGAFAAAERGARSALARSRTMRRRSGSRRPGMADGASV